MSKTRKIMIVAGEASGDAHGAKLVREIRQAEQGTAFEFFGAAGPKMRDAGVEAIVESDGLSIVGIAEIGRALPMFLRASKDLKRSAESRNPDVVVLIDFPDFNLKLAKSLKKKGFKIVYYISPQLWAWRRYRISSVRAYVDLMLTILPFEKDWYAANGVEHIEYVGNPLAREVHTSRSKEEFCNDRGIDPDKPVIGLLPGSRHKEISRIFPEMLAAAKLVSAVRPEVQFVVAIASNRNRQDIDSAVSSAGWVAENVKIVENETYDALNASDAAAVTSGTATLETGIVGTPMAIVYKTSPVNYRLLEPIINVDHYGLINLIAGERIAKELIQGDFTSASLADELLRLLEPEANNQMRSKLKAAADKLGTGGASKRAAAAILKVIDQL